MKNISNILIKNWDITKEYHFQDYTGDEFTKRLKFYVV
jgi:hypothetical protein